MNWKHLKENELLLYMKSSRVGKGWCADIYTKGEQFNSFYTSLKGMILLQELQSMNLCIKFNLVI